MLSSALSQGNRLASWNTTPTRSGSGAWIGRPWIWMVPEVWWRRPAIIISSDVLPQPLGPTITTKRPVRRARRSGSRSPCAHAMFEVAHGLVERDCDGREQDHTGEQLGQLEVLA